MPKYTLTHRWNTGEVMGGVYEYETEAEALEDHQRAVDYVANNHFNPTNMVIEVTTEEGTVVATHEFDDSVFERNKAHGVTRAKDIPQ